MYATTATSAPKYNLRLVEDARAARGGVTLSSHYDGANR